MRDLSQLKARLCGYLPDGDRIVTVKKLTAGHCNETYLLEGLNLILRVGGEVQGFLLEAHDLLTQARIMREVHSSIEGPPIPAVVSVCDDLAVIGAPLFTMEFVDGVSFGDGRLVPWLREADDRFRDQVVREFVTNVANIHQLSPLKCLPPPVDPQDELKRWLRQAEVAEDLDLVEVFSSLGEIRPMRSGSPTLVHGDAKPGNTLWREGRLVAFLDWELAFNGEPLTDLGYVLSFFKSDMHPAFLGCDLPGMWDKQAIVACWEEETGRSATGVEWYEARSSAMIAATLSLALARHRSGEYKHEKMNPEDMARLSEVRKRSVALAKNFIENL